MLVVVFVLFCASIEYYNMLGWNESDDTPVPFFFCFQLKINYEGNTVSTPSFLIFVNGVICCVILLYMLGFFRKLGWNTKELYIMINRIESNRIKSDRALIQNDLVTTNRFD